MGPPMLDRSTRRILQVSQKRIMAFRKRSRSRGRTSRRTNKLVRWKGKPRKKRGMLTKPKQKVKVSKVLSTAIKQIEYKALESKNVETALASVVVLGSAFNVIAGNIGVIGQGVTELLRIGEQITPKYLKLNYNFLNNNANTTYMRIMVVASKNIKNVAPSATELLWKDTDQDGKSYTTLNVALPHKLISLPLFSGTFMPIYSRVIKLAATATAGPSNTQTITTWLPLNGVIKYEDATGGYGLQNKIYSVIMQSWSPGLSLAASSVLVEGDATLYFKDG